MSVRLETIALATAAACGLPLAALFQRHTSKSEGSRALQAAIWLAFKLTPASRVAIGELFGGRTNNAVIHAERMAERLRARDPAFRARLDRLAADLATHAEWVSS